MMPAQRRHSAHANTAAFRQACFHEPRRRTLRGATLVRPIKVALAHSAICCIRSDMAQVAQKNSAMVDVSGMLMRIIASDKTYSEAARRIPLMQPTSTARRCSMMYATRPRILDTTFHALVVCQSPSDRRLEPAHFCSSMCFAETLYQYPVVISSGQGLIEKSNKNVIYLESDEISRSLLYIYTDKIYISNKGDHQPFA